MSAPSVSVNVPLLDESLHTAFLSILPKIETHAKVHFRSVKCAAKRADRIAEVIGMCWRWFKRLSERGKDASQFPMVLADFAVRAVRSGRRVCGQLKPKDAMSEVAQGKHGFRVESMSSFTCGSHDKLHSPRDQKLHDQYEERLRDNLQTPVPDQVAFRCDFPAWLVSRTDRDRQLIGEMAAGERTRNLSRKFCLRPSRISQMRREFCEDWARFCGDKPMKSDKHRSDR